MYGATIFRGSCNKKKLLTCAFKVAFKLPTSPLITANKNGSKGCQKTTNNALLNIS